jgi:hypothetical protein
MGRQESKNRDDLSRERGKHLNYIVRVSGLHVNLIIQFTHFSKDPRKWPSFCSQDKLEIYLITLSLPNISKTQY